MATRSTDLERQSATIVEENSNDQCSGAGDSVRKMRVLRFTERMEAMMLRMFSAFQEGDVVRISKSPMRLLSGSSTIRSVPRTYQQGATPIVRMNARHLATTSR